MKYYKSVNNPCFRSTHWKQTLFMLDGPIGVEEGDCVGGAITLQRNPIWRRHLSITIEWSIKRRNDTTFSEVMQKTQVHVIPVRICLFNSVWSFITWFLCFFNFLLKVHLLTQNELDFINVSIVTLTAGQSSSRICTWQMIYAKCQTEFFMTFLSVLFLKWCLFKVEQKWTAFIKVFIVLFRL